MSKILTIKAELDGNPGLYGGLTDAQVAAELNAVNKTQNRASMSGAEIYTYTNAAQFSALTDTQKSQWLALCAIDSIDPFGPAASLAVDIFGAGTATITALQAARVETVSRASQLGISTVHVAEITEARAI